MTGTGLTAVVGSAITGSAWNFSPRLVCTGSFTKLLNLSILKGASSLALGVACSFFVWLLPADAQQSPGRVTAATSVGSALLTSKDLSTTQSVLTIYINDLNLPGWQPQPYYMWTQASAPSFPSAPAGTSAPSTADSTRAVPAQAGNDGSTVSADGSRSLRSPAPRLPDRDVAREAILSEYQLSGFFRKSFKRGQRYIYIDLYDFQGADGAYGAYNYLRKGSTTVLPRGDAASEDDDSISFVQGKTFLSMYGTSHDDDESKEVLSKVAGEASKYLGQTHFQPSILNRLPPIDLVRGSEKIVMGPNSMRRFFPAPFLDSLALADGRVVGCVGDYQIQEPAKERLKLMILAFKSQRDAAASYKNFLTQVGLAHNQDVASMLNQPINVLKTGPTYLGIEQRGTDLLMVTGARKRFSPALVLRQVY